MFLIRIAINLIRMGLNIVLIPVVLLSRNLIGILILIGLSYVGAKYYKEGVKVKKEAASISQTQHGGTGTSADANGAAETDENGQKIQPPRVDAVTKVENGNSSFSTDLFQKMTDAERIYYSQIFYWAMGQLQKGGSHSWSNLNIAGSYLITDVFKNRKGFTCKRFKESLKVHEIRQSLDGMACQREEGGWCKLRPESTPACAIAGRSGSGGSFFNNLF